MMNSFPFPTDISINFAGLSSRMPRLQSRNGFSRESEGAIKCWKLESMNQSRYFLLMTKSMGRRMISMLVESIMRNSPGLKGH
ncbi:MAG: hypothetical protein DRH20_02210 [Deltaproteobacteria bacterium]|nr:MAG: hypothetical protein DRH20_02210 [Deltaproteobacteria bacterium]